MSWHFSRALVEEYLGGGCSDGAPFAPSNGNPTPRAYCSPDRMTACSRLSRFGMTFAALTDDHGEELLTWYRAGFPARTSAQPERAPESTASDPACGAKWHESSVRYDRASSSWKTHRSLWDEDLPWSSVTLPKWGSMRAGVCWERATSARSTAASGSGLWQTPVADDSCNRVNGKWNSRGEPKLSAQVLWPTPKANDAEKRGNFDVTNPRNGLPASVKSFATPQSRDFRSGQGARWDDPRRTRNLNDQIAKLSTDASSAVTNSTPDCSEFMAVPTAKAKVWPTPTVNDSKNCTLPPSQIKHDNIPGALLRDGEAPGGQLNPTWVEWLMGWPLGWTDLKPSATDRCRNAPPPPGASSQPATEAA